MARIFVVYSHRHEHWTDLVLKRVKVVAAEGIEPENPAGKPRSADWIDLAQLPAGAEHFLWSILGLAALETARATGSGIAVAELIAAAGPVRPCWSSAGWGASTAAGTVPVLSTAASLRPGNRG